jgi:hypothetical protein
MGRGANVKILVVCALVHLGLIAGCGSTIESAPTGGSPGGGNGSGGAHGGEGGNGDPAACAAYLDDDSPGDVTFEVRNEREASIYIGNGACQRRFEIVAGGQARQAERATFDVTCEDVQNHEYFPLDCHDFSGRRIGPGETMTLRWSGLLYRETSGMPAACAVTPENPFLDGCLRGELPRESALEVRVSLFAAASCESFSCTGLAEPFTAAQAFDLAAGNVVPIHVAR